VAENRKMINLLPQKEKEILIQEENYKLVVILGILILLFFIFLSLILFSIKVYISGELKSEKILVELRERKFKTPEVQDFPGKVEALNQNLSKLDSFYQGQIDLTKILEKVSKNLPAGVYLTTFSFQKEVSQIGISGFAPRRETLLELKENLEKEKDFAELHFPPANWVKPTNIDFYLTFRVK
jgi:Tfp pilus assembly protein PilN